MQILIKKNDPEHSILLLRLILNHLRLSNPPSLSLNLHCDISRQRRSPIPSSRSFIPSSHPSRNPSLPNMTYTLSSPSLTDPSHPSSIGTLMVLSRWSDPHWRALFQPNTTSQSAIDATAARLPYNLVSRRGATRHQVAIESETGEVVGYARWVLPGSLSSLSAGLGENGDVDGGGVVWPEAQTAEVDEATMNLFREKRKEGLDEHGRLLGLRHDLQEARSRPLEVMDEVIRKREGGMLGMSLTFSQP